MAAAEQLEAPPVCAREKCRYWIGGHGCVHAIVAERGPLTLEEVSEYFGLTRERIRQIEAIALRKLGHTARRMGIRLEDLVGDESAPSGLAAVQGEWRDYPARIRKVKVDAPAAPAAPPETVETMVDDSDVIEPEIVHPQEEEEIVAENETDILSKIRRLRALDVERQRLAEEIRSDPEVAYLLQVLGLDESLMQALKPTAAVAAAVDPAREPSAGKPQSNRDRIRAVLREHIGRPLRAGEIAAKTSLPLSAVTNYLADCRSEIERVGSKHWQASRELLERGAPCAG